MEDDIFTAIFLQNQQLIQMLHESLRTNQILASRIPGYGIQKTEHETPEELSTHGGGYRSVADNEEVGELDTFEPFIPVIEEIEETINDGHNDDDQS